MVDQHDSSDIQYSSIDTILLSIYITTNRDSKTQFEDDYIKQIQAVM